MVEEENTLHRTIMGKGEAMGKGSGEGWGEGEGCGKVKKAGEWNHDVFSNCSPAGMCKS